MRVLVVTDKIKFPSRFVVHCILLELVLDDRTHVFSASPVEYCSGMIMAQDRIGRTATNEWLPSNRIIHIFGCGNKVVILVLPLVERRIWTATPAFAIPIYPHLCQLRCFVQNDQS